MFNIYFLVCQKSSPSSLKALGLGCFTSFEAGEWQSVRDPNHLLEIQSYAKAAIAKDKRITLRLSSADLEGIQTRAIEEGIPYQTLISSVIHKYVTGRLVSTNQRHNSLSR